MAKLSRRDFVKLSAGSTAALGVALLSNPDFEKLFAAALGEVPVIWIQGASDTGCSESMLNAVGPTIYEALLGPIGQKHLSVRFHQTIMAAQGEIAMQALEDTAMTPGYVLVVEGGVPLRDNGIFCTVGERGDKGIPLLEHFLNLAPNASAVIALGACAVTGGVPAAAPNVTEIKGLRQIMADESIDTPLINLPGCPPHPDWFIGTVASILIGGLDSVELDKELRPTAFYSRLIHDHCARRAHFNAGIFSKKLGEPYCLYELGCKGPVTYADCPTRLWNNKTSWCVATNAPCAGCASMEFPDGLSPLDGKESLTSLENQIALGLAGATVLGAGAYAISRKTGGK
jgi:hydrogenase small subunit